MILTLVDRFCRYTSPVRASSKDPHTIQWEIILSLGEDRHWVHTIRADNGLEFENHEAEIRRLNAPIYFCAPQLPLAPGNFEQTNGLVRRRFPTGTCVKDLTDAEVQKVQDELNHRLQERLGWRTPVAVFEEQRARHCH